MMTLALLLVCITTMLVLHVTDGYVIGSGTQPGGNQYNPSSPTYNGGIGGGVYPNGGGNNGGGGGQVNEGGYCNSNYDCRSGLYCTASVNSVKICLSSSNGGGGNGLGGACQTSSNCKSGAVCVIRNGSGSCQIQTGGYVSPARQKFNEDELLKIGPEPGKMNSGCERDADCDNELACTLYFGEMVCRAPIKPLIPLRCESDGECPSTEYLCVFSTAMQDKVCYKYGDVVTDGYVIPIKHKTLMEHKAPLPSSATTTTTTCMPPAATSRPTHGTDEPDGVFAESEAIFETQPGSLLTSALQKRADDKTAHKPISPIYMKMMDRPSDEEVIITSGQQDGEAVRVTKVIGNNQPTSDADADGRRVGGELMAGNDKVVKIGGVGMVDDEPIDPMATVCLYDYHCRMGESCSGIVRFVDRNITVCRYDMLKKHRQCIYHSDCLSGQRCTARSKDLATCQTDITATMGEIQCFYDYECSGGEKCTLVNGGERKFVCRPSPTSDPRMNQMCTTNAQCAFQQVCRQSAGISLCVDVSISRNPAMLHERLWRFLRNFIFRRTL